MVRNLYNRVQKRIHGSKQISATVEGLVLQGLRQVLERADNRIPEFLRVYFPEVEIRTGSSIWNVQGLKVQRGPKVSTENTVEASPSPQGNEAEDGFWEDLPRGVKVDEEAEVEERVDLPKDEEPVRGMINRMRDILENLDDVADFDVMEKVDDDMYQLWRELERKMQKHKQSEAKHQLKDMFSI